MNTRFSVVIPTFNEWPHVGELLKELLALPNLEQVIIVDDSSVDGTGEGINAMCDEYAQLRVVHRKGVRSLATSLMTGYQEALQATVPFIASMDADGSHTVSDLANVIAEMAGARIPNLGVVVGSRYNASKPECVRPWWRNAVSQVGGLMIRRATGIGVSDPTSGLRCYSASALRYISESHFASTGFSIQFEVLVRVWQSGFAIKEMPISFRERSSGTSKMRLRMIKEGISIVNHVRGVQSFIH